MALRQRVPLGTADVHFKARKRKPQVTKFLDLPERCEGLANRLRPLFIRQEFGVDRVQLNPLSRERSTAREHSAIPQQAVKASG
jgi:hypothetical protein